MAETYPFTVRALQSLIFRADDNGIDAAIIRIGRRVLIDLDAFEHWIEGHRERTIDGP